jgi:hypothetical protein
MFLFIFWEKSIGLFELFDRWWKREASKSRDHIIIKGRYAAQDKNLDHI